jgi:hypothetical protein
MIAALAMTYLAVGWFVLRGADIRGPTSYVVPAAVRLLVWPVVVWEQRSRR